LTIDLCLNPALLQERAAAGERVQLETRLKEVAAISVMTDD
jgi:hypothetical protein